MCVDRSYGRGLRYMCGLCNTCYNLDPIGSKTRRSCSFQPNRTVSEPLEPTAHPRHGRRAGVSLETVAPPHLERRLRVRRAPVSMARSCLCFPWVRERLSSMGSRTGVCSQRSAVSRPVFHFRSPVSSDGTREEDGHITSSMRAHSGHRSTEICYRISATQRGTRYGN